MFCQIQYPWCEFCLTQKVNPRLLHSISKAGLSQQRYKWILAHRITNHDPKRWTWRLLAWNPEIHFDGKVCRAAQKRARPQIRWTDDLDKFSKYKSENSDWMTMVRNKTSWINNAKDYSCGDWRESECSKKEI